ncbi:uncharacterized protein C8Q71DRAFT_718104 [Rhodofomes roseus]|uniref:Uncharacterized protein n=1 Tax=Rhodofomes roseus TaxID=34475 RepID=A0ABQ8JZ77_9APHY|nr:uncharacterized protein C8Q71DRAFT_718104 [Rhodofomes roseus]KAH9829603.1 hypothetical protein C8Q71DRAFT_718104 [Rhodofomes roseus]
MATNDRTVGYRVGQVRTVFSLSKKAHQNVFQDHPDAPSHFVYLEWFSRFKPRPEPNHLFYRIQRSRTQDGERFAAIVPLESLHRSAHLIPKFGAAQPPEWTSNNVLELCETFYVNSFTDRHTYITVV